MGQGDPCSCRCRGSEDRHGVAFVAERDIAGEDPSAGNMRQQPVGQRLMDGRSLAGAERGKEFRPTLTQQAAQLGFVGVGGTTMAVCVNIL
jgi:hypothetical protein